MYGAVELPMIWEYAWFSITMRNTWSKLGTVVADTSTTAGRELTRRPQARIAIETSACVDLCVEVRARCLLPGLAGPLFSPGAAAGAAA